LGGKFKVWTHILLVEAHKYVPISIMELTHTPSILLVFSLCEVLRYGLRDASNNRENREAGNSKDKQRRYALRIIQIAVRNYSLFKQAIDGFENLFIFFLLSK
jgi:hypothetical protein